MRRNALRIVKFLMPSALLVVAAISGITSAPPMKPPRHRLATLTCSLVFPRMRKRSGESTMKWTSSARRRPISGPCRSLLWPSGNMAHLNEIGAAENETVLYKKFKDKLGILTANLGGKADVSASSPYSLAQVKSRALWRSRHRPV